MVIDSHYELKHRASISDEIIVALVGLLDGRIFPIAEQRGPFEYFVTDKLRFAGKLYKLVWLLEGHQLYVGVINAYRR